MSTDGVKGKAAKKKGDKYLLFGCTSWSSYVDVYHSSLIPYLTLLKRKTTIQLLQNRSSVEL